MITAANESTTSVPIMTTTTAGMYTNTPVYVGSNTSVPDRLEGSSNYNNWKFAMKMSLIMDGLWNCVIGEDKDSVRDQRALAKICLNVLPCCYSHVRDATTSKQAWDNLQSSFENKSLCRRLSLLRRLLRTKLEDFNCMTDYVNGITILVQQLADIDHVMKDEEVAMLLLGGLTSEYEPLIMGLEATNTSLSSDTVKSRLLQEDFRKSDDLSRPNNSYESALAVSRSKQNSLNPNSTSFKPKSKKKVICYNCNEEGHIKPKCPKLMNKNQYRPRSTSSNGVTKKGYSKSQTTFLTTVGKVDLTNDASLTIGKVGPSDWLLDSGCSSHMSNRQDWIYNYSSNTKEITIANNTKLKSAGIGDIKISLDNDLNEVTIKDVLFIPDLATNLLSVSKITEKGNIVVFSNRSCKIYPENECKIIGNSKTIANNIGGLYKLNETKPIVQNGLENTQKTKTSIINKCDEVFSATAVSREIWHRRLGHLSYKGLDLLQNKLATGVNFSKENEVKPCVPCIEGKITRKAFPKGQAKRAVEKLELIHSDCVGPMSETTYGGSRYLVTFTDDFSRKTFGYLMKYKNEVLNKFKIFKSEVENQTGLKIKRFRSDNGKGEYCNQQFTDFLNLNGIIHETTVPHTPEQNGVSERVNRTLVEKTRCLLQDSCLNKRFWGEAISTAIYLKNRSPTAALQNATPEEVWTGYKVNLSHLRVFGSKAYTHIPKQFRKKLDSKAKQYTMVGYCEHTKGYRLVDTREPKKIIKARDVVFIEEKCSEKQGSIKTEHSEENKEPTIESIVPINMPKVTEPEPTPQEDEQIDVIPDQFNDDQNVDEMDEQVPIIQNERSARDRKRPKWMNDYVSFNASIDFTNEPQTFEEVQESKFKNQWEEAMNSEYNSLIKNDVWELVDRPKDENVIKCKWIYKLKKNPDGKIEKYKARLVARGFSQKYGVDYTETFSPVVRYSTIRLLFSIANELNMDIDHADITTAFLNGSLEETIYMEQPDGFIQDENKVCLLKKSIYGLKQASRSWNTTVDSFLTSIGYTQSKFEPCVYIKRYKDSTTIIALYVDDFFIFTNSQHEKKKLRKELEDNFEAKYLGPVTNCLGMKVTRNRNESVLTLSQTNYVHNLLQRFRMTDVKPAKTPMEVKLKLEKARKEDDQTKYPYQQLIGGLLYLSVCTRPDIAYATSYLSQFNTCHNQSHWIAAKRVLRYLAGTSNYGLTFKKNAQNFKIEAFVDADWAGDSTDRKSTTGFIMKAGDCTIGWESRKQRTVALSSTEAEYLAISDVTKEVCFVKNFLSEISEKVQSITVYNDNQSAHRFIENTQPHNRTKHIDVRHHFIREAIQKGMIDIKYKPTNEMIADVLTKPLSGPKFNSFVKEFGLC